MNSEHNYSGLIPYEQSKATGYDLRVTGAQHNNFSDAALTAPQTQRIGMLGPIDGVRMLQFTKEYALAFFNKHLLGKGRATTGWPIESLSGSDFSIEVTRQRVERPVTSVTFHRVPHRVARSF